MRSWSDSSGYRSGSWDCTQNCPFPPRFRPTGWMVTPGSYHRYARLINARYAGADQFPQYLRLSDSWGPRGAAGWKVHD